MRYVAAMMIGVAAYAVTMLPMSELIHVPAESPWYLLPLLASVVAVLAAIRPWRAVIGGNRGLATAATVGSVALVLAIDLFGAVWYFCSKGMAGCI